MTPGGEAGLAALARRLEGTRLPPITMYKERCLQRRVAVRMRASRVGSMGEYVALLDRDPGEMDRLLDALTINVTSGFRNPEAWRRLGQELVRLLAGGKLPVTAWSAGCRSTTTCSTWSATGCGGPERRRWTSWAAPSPAPRKGRRWRNR